MLRRGSILHCVFIKGEAVNIAERKVAIFTASQTATLFQAWRKGSDNRMSGQVPASKSAWIWGCWTSIQLKTSSCVTMLPSRQKLLV